MDFSLSSHLDAFYAEFPEGHKQPVIGLTSNYNDSNEMLAKAYYEQVYVPALRHSSSRRLPTAT